MPQYQRGGFSITTHRLQRWFCIRQELLVAGEHVRPSIEGRVLMAARRGPAVTDTHVTLATFFTPIRYLDDNWVALVEGGANAQLSTLASAAWRGPEDAEALGLGSLQRGKTILKFWVQNYYDIYDNYLKWPEDGVPVDPAASFGNRFNSSVDGTDDRGRFGLPAVALPQLLTRYRSNAPTDQAFKDDVHRLGLPVTGSGSNQKAMLDPRALEKVKALWKASLLREWIAKGDRYEYVLQQVFNARRLIYDGKKIPHLLDRHTGWASGYDLRQTTGGYTDTSSFGAPSGITSFEVNHRPPSVYANEGGVWSLWICLRVPSLFRKVTHPLLVPTHRKPSDYTGDPDLLAGRQPHPLRSMNLFSDGNSSMVGIFPAGQHFREPWNYAGEIVSEDHVFGAMKAHGGHAINNDDALDKMFMSLRLHHAIASLRVTLDSRSPVPPATASVMVGSK